MVKRLWFPAPPDGDISYPDRMQQAVGYGMVGGLLNRLVGKVVHRDRNIAKSVKLNGSNKVIHRTHITKVVK